MSDEAGNRDLARAGPAGRPAGSPAESPAAGDFYCPQCRAAVDRPLVCGDCLAVICRECGTVLERVDDLGVG